MQNKNNIKNWKIEITNEGAKLFITEGAVMARDVLNLAREQAIKYNLSNLKIYTVYMRDGYYYDYTCAMVIHFYDRNDDYEIDSQRFYFNLSSGQWESIKNVKNKSISCKNSLACKIGDNYFMIQKSEDGYDYTLYTSDYSEIDGGQLDNPDISIYDAMNEILEDLDIEIPGHKDEIDYEELEEKVENAENERINKILSNHGCTVIAQSDCHTDFLIKSGEN